MPELEYHLLRQPGAPAARTLEEYRRAGGYQALERALQQVSPDEVLQQVKASGLRGRGGAGMSVADKWLVAHDEVEEPKYVICNAYDADPASRISRTLLEQSPHQVIEGIALAAYAVGAQEAYLFTRSGYTEGIAAVQEALREALEARTLGRDILGSDFTCSITLVAVDVGFMGGEETTLMEIIKGKRAMPQQRPPYPVVFGLWDKPTVINNLETLANVPLILQGGADAYRRQGTEQSAGTKLFTLYGPEPDAPPRLIEVPLGTTVRQALRHVGMTLNERDVRGVVVGGPEGGVLPPSRFDTPIDYEALEEAGTILGSGTIEVLPAKTCMVAWANQRMEYLAGQSCGKCVPCRLGVKRMAGTLETIISGLATPDDLKLLEEF
ncbi:MAG TPA: NADH-ubiquinone oxidoreductase-F iron-sulfur binding region domain-containing protein, partial [Ktedonobacterales bacterium]